MRILLVSAIVLSLVVFPGSIPAQDHASASIYLVPALTGAPPTPLQEQVLADAGACLRARGVPLASTADGYVLLVDACEQGDRVAVSLTMYHALPPEAIAAGAKAEVMYAGLSLPQGKPLPAEGKFVREQVSADFMRQFWMPLETKLVIVPREGVADAVRDVTTAWHRKYLAGEPRPH